MVVEIAGSVTDWATGLVFDIFTWAGVGLAGLAVVLFLVSGIIRDRQLARAQQGGATQATPQAGVDGPRRRTSLPPASAKSKGGSPIDDEMADIEALLKKRGIE
ncbi:hypothetical protein CXG46_09025 [Nocardioides alpinus]|uniref:SHOCT domain-containing protein n=1 Tax=Nocardioides alpinus TaxID=748909 RepID=A0ABX4QYQ2_9ACTN|nr:hypothetical protein CXG46_09025 [Nocardioides alpinus]